MACPFGGHAHHGRQLHVSGRPVRQGQTMDWFVMGLDGPLVVIRAIHFAGSAITAGTLIFRAVVVGPLLRSGEATTIAVRRQTLGTAIAGLAIAVTSGLPWFLLQT